MKRAPISKIQTTYKQQNTKKNIVILIGKIYQHYRLDSFIEIFSLIYIVVNIEHNSNK